MNVNSSAINVLCFGDSNTYGQKTNGVGRHRPHDRWPGVLQEKLGSDFNVIEEGLGGRTTNLEHPIKPGRNGKTYLAPCLHSHNPVDIIIIMLGTNDLKTAYKRTAELVTTEIGGLIDEVREYGLTDSGTVPKIILISPVHINTDAPLFKLLYAAAFNQESEAESKRLAPLLKTLAQEKGVMFIDAASVVKPGADGIHLEAESAEPLASLIATHIESVFKQATS